MTELTFDSCDKVYEHGGSELINWYKLSFSITVSPACCESFPRLDVCSMMCFFTKSRGNWVSGEGSVTSVLRSVFIKVVNTLPSLLWRGWHSLLNRKVRRVFLRRADWPSCCWTLDHVDSLFLFPFPADSRCRRLQTFRRCHAELIKYRSLQHRWKSYYFSLDPRGRASIIYSDRGQDTCLFLREPPVSLEQKIYLLFLSDLWFQARMDWQR